MGKLLIGFIVLLIVGAGVYYFYDLNSDNAGEVISGNNVNGVKTFVLTGENFKFMMDGSDNPDIKVNQGDKVRIEFSSAQGFHDWIIDEFSVATAQIGDTNESTFVEFIASEKGTFEYYCSVGQHRANGMKGNLIIE